MPSSNKVARTHKSVLDKKFNWARVLSSRFRSWRRGHLVAEHLLRNGISVRQGRLFVNTIHLPLSCVAKDIGVDSRTVAKVIKEIEQDSDLCSLFASLRVNPSFELPGLGVVVIVFDPSPPIDSFAKVADVISRLGANIVNANADYGALSQIPEIRMVLDHVPYGLVNELRNLEGVKQISYIIPSSSGSGSQRRG